MASSRGSRSPPRKFRSPPRQRQKSSSRSPRSPIPSRRRSPQRRFAIVGSVSRSRSRSPSLIRSSRSHSRTPPNRRRPRSPSFTPPVRERNYQGRKGNRISPLRRRRRSPGTRPHADSLSRSRSPPRGYNSRRRSASPPPRRRSPRFRSRRSLSGPLTSRSPSPRRRSRSSDRRSLRRKGRYESRSRSQNPIYRDDAMNADEGDRRPGGSGELKIRGQAEVERRKSKWDEEPIYSSGVSSLEFDRYSSIYQLTGV